MRLHVFKFYPLNLFKNEYSANFLYSFKLIQLLCPNIQIEVQQFYSSEYAWRELIQVFKKFLSSYETDVEGLSNAQNTAGGHPHRSSCFLAGIPPRTMLSKRLKF